MMRLGIDWDEEDAAEQAARQEKASKTRNTATVAAEPAVANAVAPPTAAASAAATPAAPPVSPASTAKAPQSFAESIIRRTEPYWNPIHLKPGVKEFKSYEDVDPYATGAHAVGEFLSYWHGVRPVIGGIGTRINKSIAGIDPTIKAQIAATNATNESKEKIAAMKYGQPQGPDRTAVPTPEGRIEPTFDTTPLPDGPSPASPEAIATNSAKPNPLDLYAQQKHGVSLSTLEQASGGPLTKQADIDIIANQFNKGQGITVNTLPGKISNQPAGIPGAINPMNQLTTQPPAPQMIQPNPVAPVPQAPAPAAPVAPVQAAPAAAQPSLNVGEAVATNGNVDQAIKQTVANQLDATAPQGMRENYKRSKTEPIGPGAFNHLANNVGLDNATKIWQEVYGQKNVPYAEYMAQYSKAAGKEMQGPVRPLAEGAKLGGSFGTPKYIPEYIKGSASPQALMATAGAAAIPALAAAGYHAYQGNKEKVNAELKDAWNSMKSVVTMPVDVAKAAGKGDFEPFKDLLMSINPGTLLMNEANKRDESAIQRMIQAEKVGAGRGIAPPSAYQR